MNVKESISACLAVKAPIAKVVLMPGDPLRAKAVADKYLEDVVVFNDTRNMLGFTGVYQGRLVSVMGSGMGIPSMGLYAKELYDQFDVDAIIRIGSAGGLSDEVNLRDIIIAQGASSNSNYGNAYGLPGQLAAIADYSMLEKAVDACRTKEYSYHVGKVYTSDFFYYPDSSVNINQKAKDLNHLAVEMETAGLYWTACGCNKKALSILTISDHLYKDQALSAIERQESFHEMMEVALETAWHFAKEK